MSTSLGLDGTNDDLDPLSSAQIYYGPDRDPKKDPRFRSLSSNYETIRPNIFDESGYSSPSRRGSHGEPHGDRVLRRLDSPNVIIIADEKSQHSRKYLIPVESTLKTLLAREDTDHNYQITIDDAGPKVINLGTLASSGYRKQDVRGTYMLSNLLQELTLAKGFGRDKVVLDEARLSENPVDRLSRVIRTAFWDNLTRRIDASNIDIVAKDPKDWTNDPRPRIYVPRGAPEQYAYYKELAEKRPEMRLDVQLLRDEKITGEYIRDLNGAPGLLAIAMEECTDEEGNSTLRGLPFVVPGGRFNELYGWDSYMISVGLVVNGRVDLAKAMVMHFCFCIRHYGKIFNANRSYYLGRSQPPFLTDMAFQVFDKMGSKKDAREFLKVAIQAAIKEYHGVWMAAPRLDPISGLSRYRPVGMGVPPETETSHFTHIIAPYAKAHNMTHEEFVRAYDHREILEPKLDDYFLHDRAVRESGHDTSYRLEKVAANLATIDLNALLYRYEVDISRAISAYFNDALAMPAEWCAEGMTPGHVETSALWDRRAKKRRALINKYLWNAEKGMYFDYNTVTEKQTDYETATTFWALWAGVANPQQAAKMVEKALPRFEVFGGLVSGTEESRGEIGLDRPNRQWDYPYGWAPQQILAWVGLERYGYYEEAQRLAYRWLYMVTKAFSDFNGVVVEKYNVTQPIDPHRVDAEYGNQGSDFKGVAKEGFGWVNASYVYGLTLLTAHMKRALGTLTPWDTFHRMTDESAIV